LAGTLAAYLIKRAESSRLRRQEVIQRRRDLSEARQVNKIAKICGRRSEHRVIEEVEILHAEIQSKTFGKREAALIARSVWSIGKPRK